MPFDEISQLRDVLRLPVPPIFTWSSDPGNPVGAEYIIEERAPGVKLGTLWKQWPRENKLKIIQQIAVMEEQLASVKFRKHGSIYFKEDIQGHLRDETNILLEDPSISTDVSRFAMGPLASVELWQSGRESMELDRGPCTYFQCLIRERC